MISRKDGKKLPNPLSEEQRRVIFELCRYAKSEDILQGWQRKFLYQAGMFDEWFTNRFGFILSILQELSTALPSGEKHDSEDELREIIKVVGNVDVGEDVGFAGVHHSTVETLNLERLVSLGNAEPQERLRLAELYEETGEINKAKSITKDLLKEFPSNQTIIKLYARLGGRTPKSTSNKGGNVTMITNKAAKPVKSPTAQRCQTADKIVGTRSIKEGVRIKAETSGRKRTTKR